MVLRAGDLSVTTASLGHPPFDELLAAVAGAGFRALAMWPENDWQRALTGGWSEQAIRTALDDNGLVVWEVEAAVQWVGPDDPGGPYLEEPARRLLYDCATSVGAPAVLAVLIGPKSAGRDDVVEGFAGLCDEAAERGLRVHLEFGLGTQVRSLVDAVSVVQAAGRPNAGIVADTWAMHWSRTTIADIERVPGHLVSTVQVNDAPAERPSDYARATRYERLVPGEGAVPLAAMIGALRRAGSTAPLELEVLDPERAAREGARRWAGLLADAGRRLLEPVTD